MTFNASVTELNLHTVCLVWTVVAYTQCKGLNVVCFDSGAKAAQRASKPEVVGNPVWMFCIFLPYTGAGALSINYA